MKEPKLLFFASCYTAGLAALLVDQLTALVECGVDAVAIAGETDQEEGLTEKMKRVDCPFLRFDGLDVHARFGQHAREIRDVIDRYGITVVHVQNNWQLALVNFVRLRYRKPVKVIYTIHAFRHNHPVKSRIAQWVIGTGLLMGADKVICMCEYLRGKFSLLNWKIALLPLGITDSFFTDAHPALPGKGIHAIFPAQFRAGKQQYVLIRAFARHCQQSGDTESTLTLPGEGELKEDFKALAGQLGVGRQVIFPGLLTKEQVREAYLQSNVGLVSSNCETFGQSIVEPYVLGRCVVSTPVGVALDIVENGKSGYIWNTEEELTGIFDTLYSHPDLLATIGRHNFECRDSFRWRDISIQYKEMIEKL